VNCWLDKIEIFSALYGSLRYYEKQAFFTQKTKFPVLHNWSARRDSFKGIWKLILDTWTVRNVVTKDTSEFLLKNLKIKLLVDNWNLCMCITMELATKTIRDNNCLIIAKFVVFEMISLFFSHSLTVTTFAAMLKMLLFIFFIDYFNQPNVSESGSYPRLGSCPSSSTPIVFFWSSKQNYSKWWEACHMQGAISEPQMRSQKARETETKKAIKTSIIVKKDLQTYIFSTAFVSFNSDPRKP